MRFPDRDATIFQGGHLGGGGHGQIFGGGGVFELASVIVALIGNAEFLEQEHHFLNVAGGGPAEQLIHGVLLAPPERALNSGWMGCQADSGL